MLTQCPSCLTTFRITSEILRVADGQVRCGRCQTQFDALQRLIGETDAGEIHTGRFLRPSTAPPAAAVPDEIDDPASREDITLEGRHIEISGRFRVADAAGGEPQVREETVEEWVEIDDFDAAEPSAADESEVQQALEELQEPERISDEEEPGEEQPEALRLSEPDLEADSDDDVADGRAEDAEADAIEETAIEAGAEASQEQIADDTDYAGEPQRKSAAPWSELWEPAAAEPDAAEELDLTPRRVRRPAPLIWKILAAPLVLVLVAQFIHHHRATLALHPRIGPTLISVYDALGLSIRPDWDLHAYEILQWHVASDPAAPGTLRVRASIKNVADFAQPYPLLRLVLEDRWGEQVRAREFTPAEYREADSGATRLLAPAQLTKANISIVDPGPDAEGFRFDVCLKGARGPVCAADVPER